MPERFEVPKRSRDVGPARAPALGGLVLGEHGLDKGANDVHEGGTKNPAKGNGQLEGALTSRGVCPFFCWDPNAEVSVGAKNLNA